MYYVDAVFEDDTAIFLGKFDTIEEARKMKNDYKPRIQSWVRNMIYIITEVQ